MEQIESLDGVAVTVLIGARPETVFGILTTEAGLSAWLNADATFEPTVGSSFSLFFTQFQARLAGEVREVVPDQLLALTWGYADGPQSEAMPAGSTLVTFKLTPEEGGTRVTVSHEGLSAALEDGNRQGWRFLMSRLNLAANRSQLGSELPGVLDAYFEAWSIDDDVRRQTLLEGCCEEDVQFMDDYASLTGRDTLAQHASNTRNYFPGSRIRRVGDPSICRGEVLVPFEVVDANGVRMSSGTNYGVVSPRGLLKRVTGFWTP